MFVHKTCTRQLSEKRIESDNDTTHASYSAENEHNICCRLVWSGFLHMANLSKIKMLIHPPKDVCIRIAIESMYIGHSGMWSVHAHDCRTDLLVDFGVGDCEPWLWRVPGTYP